MSTKKSAIIPEKIHLASVNIFQANLSTDEDFLEYPQKVEGFEFGIAHEVAHNFELGNSRFRLFFTMDGRNKDDQPLGVKVEYGIEFHFHVENFQSFLHKLKNGTQKMDMILPATLLGMAYSTARGMIFERTRGTFFDGVILPVINPFEVLQRETPEIT